MNGQNLTKFYVHIIIDKIYVGIINRHFCKFATELRPLIDARIQFLFNIMRMNGQNLIKFCIHFIIDKINIGIISRHFSQICNRVTALDLLQNSVFVQYFENEWTELNQILYTHYH